MGSVRKVAISLEPELLDEIDASAEERGMSRSKYIRDVLRDAIIRARDEAITARIDRVFQDAATDLEQLEVSEELLGASIVSDEQSDEEAGAW